jgi:aspartate--ammonia ligase
MQTNNVILDGYNALLNLRETEKAIRLIKEFFQTNLAVELNLLRVTAPLFVRAGTGINDNLNGMEMPVSFRIKHLNNTPVEIVQSLAKWKRLVLADYRFEEGEGLYTDMNAIRPDETLDNLHSIYVDQWDWELRINPEQRNLDFLKTLVRKIYDVIRRTERYVSQQLPVIKPFLPDSITFIHSEELE